MNAPRCFSQFSAGSRTSRGLGAHLAILGGGTVQGEVHTFILSLYIYF